MKRRFIHRDGPFTGGCEGASYAEFDGASVTMVWPDGRTLACPNVGPSEVADFIDRGWWIEREVP